MIQTDSYTLSHNVFIPFIDRLGGTVDTGGEGGGGEEVEGWIGVFVHRFKRGHIYTYIYLEYLTPPLPIPLLHPYSPSHTTIKIVFYPI